MVMFKIGDVDYSNRVIANNYTVEQKEVYTAWQDANKTEHRSLERYRIEGGFLMFFPTIEEYEAFCENIETAKNDDLSVAVTVCDNKTNTEAEINAYIDYTPARRKNGVNADIMDVISILLTER